MQILGHLTRGFTRIEIEVYDWERTIGTGVVISSEKFDDVSLALDENHSIVLSYTDSEGDLHDAILKKGELL